jgi:hypothetical protein
MKIKQINNQPERIILILMIKNKLMKTNELLKNNIKILTKDEIEKIKCTFKVINEIPEKIKPPCRLIDVKKLLLQNHQLYVFNS